MYGVNGKDLLRHYRDFQSGFEKVVDSFDVQKLAFDSVREIRIQHRWQAMNQENQANEVARQSNLVY